MSVVFLKFASILLCFAIFYASWTLGTCERDLRSELCKREDTPWPQLRKQEPKSRWRVWMPLLWMRLSQPRGQLSVERSGVGAVWGTPGSESGTREALGGCQREKIKNKVGCKKMLAGNKIRRFRMGNRNGRTWGTVGSEAAKTLWEGAKVMARWCPQPLCGSTIAGQRPYHFTKLLLSL